MIKEEKNLGNTNKEQRRSLTVFPILPEAEFMNVSFLGMRALRLEVSIYNVYINKPVSNHFCSREGGK